MQVSGIGGVFFRAEDPEALAAWYREVFGIEGREGFWQQDAGPTVFAPFAKDSAYFDRPEQQWMVNLRVEDLEAAITELKARGLEVITKPEWESPYGRYARIYDPEGNPIELWQPSGA